MRRALFTLSAVVVLAAPATAQSAAATAPAAAATPTLPPATKLEGFKPAAGSAVTIAYTTVGSTAGVSVDARESRDAKGTSVRGLVVEVTQTQYREERSFVDADEILELLRGVDYILAVKDNPAPAFKSFEVRYRTRGELEVTAFSSRGAIRYAVQAGRTLKAQTFLDEGDMRKFRELVVSAQTVLGEAASAK